MANMVLTGMSVLAEQIGTHASNTVTYSRGGQSVSLAAAPGRTNYRIADDYGSRLEYGDRDYVIQVAVLKLGGVATRPEVGDRITEADGSIYEVLTAFGESAWRYSDPQKFAYRVHTKKVG